MRLAEFALHKLCASELKTVCSLALLNPRQRAYSLDKF